MYDIIIVGASFSGLMMAGQLDKNLKILVLERKESIYSTMETTGLITNRTKAYFEKYIGNIDDSLLHNISSIGVVAPNFEDFFLSTMQEPWIYTTNPNELMKIVASKFGENITIKYNCEFKDSEMGENEWIVKTSQGTERCRLLIGADGALSQVAIKSKVVSTNQKMLIGFEKLFPGKILKGRGHGEDIYHFWFGEMALGYGGWMSPDFVDGEDFVRIGFAIHKENAFEQKKMELFIEKLIENNWIEIDKSREDYFADLIPAGGVVDKVYDKKCLLIGDAAGICGPFAADGIQGAIVSGYVAAQCSNIYFKNNNESIFDEFLNRIEEESGLISYYKKQIRYRFLWERFKSNKSFDLLYRICEKKKKVFLENYCKSKDHKKSLTKSLFVPSNSINLVKLGFSLINDQIRSDGK